ncbi:MAG: hypothetical protein JXB35_10475 [Anaerolineae bacterium]|nr:hypothetical protein [Anaerolineae bacterium]
MNLDRQRLRMLTPGSSLTSASWSGTVVSYDIDDFELTVTTVSGSFPTDIANLVLVHEDGDMVRVRSRSGSVLYLSENPLSFAAGETVTLYNLRLPWPRYQRIVDGVVYKDFEIPFPGTWQAELPPTAILQARVGSNDYAEAVYCTTGQTITLDASGSYANLDTGTPLSYNWTPGAGGTITGSGSTVTCAYTTTGFRYLKLVVTDAHGSGAVRYLPIWVVTPGYSVAQEGTVTRVTASWDTRQGWTVDLDVQGVLWLLQWSPVALVDADTYEVLFFGFYGAQNRIQTFQETTTSVRMQSALAFSRQLHAYPFLVTGLTGAETPDNWAEVYDLTLARAAWFLLYWHSVLPEVVNCDLSDAPERQIAGQEFSLGSLPQQLEAVLQSAFWQARGWRAGGFVVTTDPLFLDSGDWAALSGVDLSDAADLREQIGCEFAQPTVNQVRCGGVYRTVGGTFEPALVQAPRAPAAWGSPAEVNGLAPATEFELQAWAGRYVGVENTADKYTAEPGIEVNPAAFWVADLPGGVRCAVERVTLEFATGTLAWRQRIEGRTYGRTAGAVTVPQPPDIVYPDPELPPVDPPDWPVLPEPEPVSWPVHLWVATEEGGVYETQDFTPPEETAQPTWTAINTGLDALRCVSLRTSVTGTASGYGYLLVQGIGGDDAVRRVYKRGFWGDSWSSILTHTEAETLTGSTLIELYDLDVDPTTGYVYVLTGSATGNITWYVLQYDGSSWSVYGSGVVSDRVPYRFFVRGTTIMAASGGKIGSGAWGGRVALSKNCGVTWKLHSVNIYYTIAEIARVSNAQPDVAYYDRFDDIRKVYDGGGSGLAAVTVAPDDDLGDNYGCHWISNTYPHWQRVIRDDELLETLDDWSSVDVVETFTREYQQLIVLHEAEPAREDWMILGNDAPSAGSPHTVFALDQTNDPGTVIGKSGTAPGTSPYANSIPYTAGGIIFEGIRIIV